MIEFIKDSSIINIKKKFELLYLLNVSDIVLTLLLYSSGFFKEINFLLASIIDNKLISLSIKILIPGILLLLLYIRMKKATDHQLYISNYVINIALLFYTLVNVLHILWIILLQTVTILTIT